MATFFQSTTNHNNKINKSKKMMTLIDNFIQIFCVVFVADALYRLYLVGFEYFQFPKYYLLEDKIQTIMKRAFTYNFGTCCFCIGLCFFALVWSLVIGRIPWPNVKHLAGIPIYWICCLLKINHSTLDYAFWVRESHGLDYAEGMSSNYFHGYLKLVLPSHNGHLGIRERIQQYENAQQVKFAINRLVILIPNTMFVDGKIESRHLEESIPLETVTKDRAGVKRPFKNDVYKLKIRNQDYYIAMEGATPMLSYFNAMNFQLSSTWQMREMQREILLKFYKHLKMLLKEYPETQKVAELIIYNAYTSDGRPQDIGDVLIAHIENLWKNQ